ncbi:MAG: hypothetical protein AB7S97_01115 [Thermoplasmata archaeon]
MRLMKGSERDDTAPRKGWPERIDRPLFTVLVALLLVGTPLVSVGLLSKDTEAERIVVEADSYYAVRIGLYGYGSFNVEYRVLMQYQLSVLLLDRFAFERFKAGLDDYESDPFGWSSTSASSGGFSGGGFQWELFLVFVNPGSFRVTVLVENDSTPYFSLPVASMILFAALAVRHQWLKRSAARTPSQATVPAPPGSEDVRRRALFTIAKLTLLLIAVVAAIGMATPRSSSMFPPNSFIMAASILVGTVICMAIAFRWRFMLATVKGRPDAVLSDLAYRLRVSGYRVSQKPDRLSVRVSTTSAVDIFVRTVPEGTLVSYCADCTPMGWGIFIVLLLTTYMTPLAFAAAMFVIYRSAVFVAARVLPRLSGLPVPGPQVENADTRVMLVASLSEGRRLSSEAYEAARSSYHDAVIVRVTVGIVLSTVAAILGGLLLLRDLGTTGLTLSALIAAAAGLGFTAVSWRLLAKKAKPRISELGSWAARLEAALSREVSSESPPDDEPSSFELILQSYAEIPGWLKVRRKAGTYRYPWHAMAVVGFAYLAVMNFVSGITATLWGEMSYAAPYFAMSAASAFVSVFIYLRWRRRMADEDKATVTDLTGRLQALKAEMEAYLGGL